MEAKTYSRLLENWFELADDDEKLFFVAWIVNQRDENLWNGKRRKRDHESLMRFNSLWMYTWNHPQRFGERVQSVSSFSSMESTLECANEGHRPKWDFNLRHLRTCKAIIKDLSTKKINRIVDGASSDLAPWKSPSWFDDGWEERRREW